MQYEHLKVEVEEQLKALVSQEDDEMRASFPSPRVVGRQALHLQSRTHERTERWGREELAALDHLT